LKISGPSAARSASEFESAQQRVTGVVAQIAESRIQLEEKRRAESEGNGNWTACAPSLHVPGQARLA